MSNEPKPPSQPVSGYVQEVRPDDPPPSCTICGKDMVRDGDSYRCQSCGNTTRLSQPASVMSAEQFWPQYLSSVGMAAYDTLNFKKAFAIEFAEVYAARELAILRAECESLREENQRLRQQTCDKQYHMYVWTKEPFFYAVAQAKTVNEARMLMLEEIGAGDGSCPEREKAFTWIHDNNPTIYHRENATFGLTDSAELREVEDYCEKMQKRAKSTETECDSLKQELDALKGKRS